MTIDECLKNYNEIVIGGLEGCKKTKMIIEKIVEKFNKKEFTPEDVVVLAFKSYSLMKEKQKDIMMEYGWDEKECPIVSYMFNQQYEEFYTNKKFPYKVSKEAKILLTTQKCLQKDYCQYFEYETPKTIKWVCIDEFDPVIGIIPSLHYLTKKWLDNELNDSNEKINKMTFIKFINREYSDHDAKKIKQLMSNNENYVDDTFMVAWWIQDNIRKKIKTIFLTSEILAIRILNSIGFSNPDLNYEEFLDHTIHIMPENIDRFFFNTLNKTNKWNIFGFETIITDKYSSKLLKYNELDLKVVNHTMARGTNKLVGNNKLLTILSHIPSSVIAQIVEMLSKNEGQEVGYQEIEIMYYRDRLYQAVGRVIGHRGVCDPKKIVKDTYVLANYQLCDMLMEQRLNKDLKLCYTFKRWAHYTEEINSFLQLTESFREKSKGEKVNNISEEKQAHINELTKICDTLFEIDNNSRIPYDMFLAILKENGCEKVSKKDIGKIANYFGGSTKRTSKYVSIDNEKKLKLYHYIKGVRKKT